MMIKAAVRRVADVARKAHRGVWKYVIGIMVV
jgi:hypothetical protein